MNPATRADAAGTTRRQPARNRSVALLVFADFQLLDAAGPVTVFEAASALSADHGYEVALVSLDGGLVRSSAGIAVETLPLTGLADADTLLVAGGAGTRGAGRDPRLAPALAAHVTRMRRIASVCTGAFLLAEAGLLDGRRATTHWRHCGLLARAHPAVRVMPDRIWVHDGHVWTSAGVSAGIDLALALVTEDLGTEVARACAREVVVYYQRPGGQSQFSSVEALGAGSGRFGPLLAWIRGNVGRRLGVEELAAHVAMSPRNFSRRFRAEVGRTPAQAVTQIRLEVARTLLESSHQSIEKIAHHSGFGDAERMRRAFVRSVGQPPRALRTAAAAR